MLKKKYFIESKNDTTDMTAAIEEKLKEHGVMRKIFLYLDAHPSGWQFSLFELSDHKGINFEKTEGSLVYTADKKED